MAKQVPVAAAVPANVVDPADVAVPIDCADGDISAPPTPWGRPPLIDGEDEEAYGSLLDRLMGELAPDGVIEEMWTRNIVDLAWQALRLRRIKADLVSACAQQGLERVLVDLIDWSAAHDLARNWALNDDDAHARVADLLGRAVLDENAIIAQALAARIDDVERLDRMVVQAEARRDAVLAQFERRRVSGACRLTRADAVDADYDEGGAGA